MHVLRLINPSEFFIPDVMIGNTTHPSIAALVGSMDAYAARYATTVRVQTARIEMIADLRGMAVELMRMFYQRYVFVTLSLTHTLCSTVEVLGGEHDCFLSVCESSYFG